MSRLQNNPSIGWVHPKSTHGLLLTWGQLPAKKKGSYSFSTKHKQLMLKCWNFHPKKMPGNWFFGGNIENIQKYYEIFNFQQKNLQNKIIIWHWNVELAMYLNGTYLVISIYKQRKESRLFLFVTLRSPKSLCLLLHSWCHWKALFDDQVAVHLVGFHNISTYNEEGN
jgi:hypothetical protein